MLLDGSSPGDMGKKGLVFILIPEPKEKNFMDLGGLAMSAMPVTQQRLWTQEQVLITGKVSNPPGWMLRTGALP